MCCTLLAEKYRTRKLRKNRHLRTIAQGCQSISSQLRHVLTIGKKILKQQYLLHMSSQYGDPRPTNGWDRFGSLGHPTNFNGFRVLASLLHQHRSTEVNQTLHGVWPSSGLVHYRYILGLFPLTEFCQVQNSLCVQVLHSPILAALLHDTRAVGVSQTLRAVQGMEMRNFRSSSFATESTTYIPRAAITLGIGPHSSCILTWTVELYTCKVYHCFL